jgi:hypothetical protein
MFVDVIFSGKGDFPPAKANAMRTKPQYQGAVADSEYNSVLRYACSEFGITERIFFHLWSVYFVQKNSSTMYRIWMITSYVKYENTIISQDS